MLAACVVYGHARRTHEKDVIVSQTHTHLVHARADLCIAVAGHGALCAVGGFLRLLLIAKYITMSVLRLYTYQKGKGNGTVRLKSPYARSSKNQVTRGRSCGKVYERGGGVVT